jgi:CCR4-NOT transcriptional complex subunit CAF120
LLQRPSSRGANAALGPLGSGDITTTLSAREQEHIARVTGQPLINHVHNPNRPAGAGLVGAIQARESEREQMKKGINSQAVQNAITQRQQQAMYQQQDYRATQSQHGNMGMGGQYPQAQYNGQDAQPWVSPAANVYAQGGGFYSPTSVYPGSPEVGQQQTPPPMPFASPPQQYFPPQQRAQQGQGRGYAAYQGRQ